MKYRRIIIFLLVLVSSLMAYSQGIILGRVQDGFLKVPLENVKLSLLLAKDSTVVIDSIPLRCGRGDDGILKSTTFQLTPQGLTGKYLLRASLNGYEDAWYPLELDANKRGGYLLDNPLELRRIRQTTLGEATVTATRVKMYYKGDTLVYNADAFQLPDGSMLDALIRQLPGVTLDENGQIFVNGRKVDELLLGSRSFMSGNKKVLLENLPYYTVKDIKVYDKQTAMSEALGRDVEPRRYVMDVSLKKEYSKGYIANMEVAGGTEKRWLGRGFLLGFADKWRYSLMANANNVNEDRHIGGGGHWTPATMPQSLLTTRSVATNLNYHSGEKHLSNDLTVDFTSKTARSEMRRRYEQFLEGSRPTSLTEENNKSDNWRLGARNELHIPRLYSITQFEYYKRNGTGLSQFNQWDDGLTASMHTDALNEVRGWSVQQQAQGGYQGKNKRWSTYHYTYFYHGDNKSWLSNRYDTWHASTQTQDVRYNANERSSQTTFFILSNRLMFEELFGKVNLSIDEGLEFSDNRDHDYLYHPDTLLLSSQLDMLEAITDPSNSYDSYQRKWKHSVSVSLYQYAMADMSRYTRWNVGVDVPVYHHRLDYERGSIDTLMHGTWVYVRPNASYCYYSAGDKHMISLNAEYKCEPVDMVSQIAYRDDSQPLVVKLGNPALKGLSASKASMEYAGTFAKQQTGQIHLSATFNYRHRDVAQSVAYDPSTGVYTYKPMNVKGAYDLVGKFDISTQLDKKRCWTWQMNADAGFVHALDHAMLAGETASHVNAVNTLTLHDGAYIQYSKGKLNVRATGDVRWRRSEGRMYDFETLKATDYRYGLSARYTIPVLNTTVSAEGTMYSRRGYGSAELNTDDFVLNASLSQSFLKGRLVARIEAFDLLHQLSSTRYDVNAQGRTETWYRSLPHYVMAHLVFHFNKNPKKQ